MTEDRSIETKSPSLWSIPESLTSRKSAKNEDQDLRLISVALVILLLTIFCLPLKSSDYIWLLNDNENDYQSNINL